VGLWWVAAPRRGAGGRRSSHLQEESIASGLLGMVTLTGAAHLDGRAATALCLPHSLAHRPAHGAWPLDLRQLARTARTLDAWAAAPQRPVSAEQATNAREWAAALQRTHGFAVPLTGDGLVWAVAAALGAGAWHRRRSAVVGAVLRGGEP
jgi:hypothetical protein